MKKGLLLVPFMSGKGGTETVIHNLFTALSKQNQYKISIYSIGGSKDYNWSNGTDIHIQEISSKRFIRTSYYLTFLPHRIYKIIKQTQPDFIISTNPVMWFLSKVAVKRLHLNIPIIAWYHYSLQQKPIKKLFLNSADYFLAISSSIKKQLIKLGIQNHRIFLIYNPVESNYKVIPRPKDKCHFIYLGRVDLDKQKNVRELLQGLTNVSGDWTLDIYGDDSNAEPVKEYAKKLKISDHLSWKGFIKEPWSHINVASSLVLTSNYEGLPMVLCEAISHGIYCISSDIETGPNDIIENGINGKLYKPHDINQLTNDLQNVIYHPNNLPNQKQIINSSQKFSIDNYGKYFTNALNNIL